jgi:hypothetical protein
MLLFESDRYCAFSFSLCARVGFVLLLVCLVDTDPAAAQELKLLPGVAERVAPSSQDRGVALGGGQIDPKLDLSTGYDDNILAIETNTLQGARFQIAPSLGYRKKGSSYSLATGAFLSSRLYTEETSQDNLDWGVGGSGELSVIPQTGLRAMVGYQYLTDPRGGINPPAEAPTPSQYGLIQSSVAGDYTLGDFEFSLAANLQIYDYNSANQKYRNREVYSLTGQIAYTFLPGYSVFVRATNTKTDFNNLSDPLPPPTAPGTRVSQDNDGERFAVGFASQVTDTISGEAYVGYLVQRYNSDLFEKIDGVLFHVDLKWAPSSSTSVSLKASRDVVDANTLQSGGILYSVWGIEAEHQVLKGLGLKAGFSYYSGDYVGAPRDDHGYLFSLRADYRLSSVASLDLQYLYDDRDSNQAGEDYTRNQVSLGVKLEY